MSSDGTAVRCRPQMCFDGRAPGKAASLPVETGRLPFPSESCSLTDAGGRGFPKLLISLALGRLSNPAWFGNVTQKTVTPWVAQLCQRWTRFVTRSERTVRAVSPPMPSEQPVCLGKPPAGRLMQVFQVLVCFFLFLQSSFLPIGSRHSQLFSRSDRLTHVVLGKMIPEPGV